MDHIWEASSRLKKSHRTQIEVAVEPYIISLICPHPVDTWTTIWIPDNYLTEILRAEVLKLCH